MKNVRLGVIGVGDVAQRDYLPEFHRLAGRADLVAVASRSEARARAVALEYGAARWATDWRTLLTDDVDAILNLTPIAQHAEITRAALEAGKHVYSEKPLAASPEEAAELARLADSRGLVLVAAPSIGVFPQIQEAARVVESGRLGAVHCFRSHAYAGTPPWDGYDSDPRPYFGARGGPLRDMAVYPLHALTWIFGPIDLVTAVSRRTRDSFVPLAGPLAGVSVPVESDDDWHVIVRTRSGVVGPIQVNFCAREAAAPEFEIQGEHGTVALALLDVAQPLRVLAANAENWVDEPVPHQRNEGPDHLLGVEHLVDCIHDGGTPLLSAAHAIHVLDVLDAAEQSSASGRAVEVSSTFPWHSPLPEGSHA